jgi:hypothetical protein
MKSTVRTAVLAFLLLFVATSTLACFKGWKGGFDGRYRFWRWFRCFHCEKPGPETECIDSDQDGYYAYDEVNCPEGDDCDDSDPEVNPGISEDPDGENCNDGKDNDCDGLIDMEDPDCEGGVPQ